MITEKEINISNQSYTKKDFYQIYPEILELATKMSQRWDPQSSNESDPGVVLLKLLAFVADKNNYVIDKSILEAFMPSATQEDSMRKLCSMMGYDMGYYKSATTYITFAYRGQKDGSGNEKLLNGDSIPIKIFTSITSEDDSVHYITIEPISLSPDALEQTVPAMEGQIVDVEVGESDIISLENIDDSNRFYLPETMIAENGIFIRRTSDTDWDRWSLSPNLNTEIKGSLVYEFKFDSRKQLPYIQFPDDIDDLIGEGLYIKYVRTTGVNGNINAKVLSKLDGLTKLETTNGVEIDLNTEEEKQSLYINNASATINGSNLETIDEAYNSFKKTVGTFNTLVTVRDYANAIYNLTDSLGTSYISNIQVSDIRNDLNKTTQVVTYDDFGLHTKTVGTGGINSFDLYLYPLGGSYNYYNKTNYMDSFKYNTSRIVEIKQGIEENKTMSHVIQTPSGSDLVCYKGYYNLKAKVTTNYKVNSSEEREILNNIYFKLYNDFNARKVDFGEEIPYDSILKSMEEADPRIKNIFLEEPTITMKWMDASGNEDYLFGNSNLSSTVPRAKYLDMLAKNILAGKISLFKFIDGFKLNYGEHGINLYGTLDNPSNKITTLKTILAKTTPAQGGTAYILGKNECIQFMAPNYRTALTYPGYINYYWKGNNLSSNTDYELTGTDHLYIVYTDSDDVVHNLDYSADKKIYDGDGIQIDTWEGIIRPNFSLENGSTSTARVVNPTSGIPASWGIDRMFQLTTSQTIEIREKVTSELKGPNYYYFYWIVNESSNSLKNKLVSDKYVLEEGEYICYTNREKTDLVILGSGTEIDFSSAQSLENEFGSLTESVSLDDISSEGLGAFSDNNWRLIQFNNSSTILKFNENQIITLTEGDTLNFAINSSDNGINLKEEVDSETYENTFISMKKASYRFASGETGYLESNSALGWKIKGRLDLNVGPDLPQELKSSHELYYKYGTGSFAGPLPNIFVKTNYLLQTAGSSNIDVRVKKVSLTTGEEQEVNDFNIMSYSNTSPTQTGTNSGDLSIGTVAGRYTSLSLKDISKANLKIGALPNSFNIVTFYYLEGPNVGSGATLPTLKFTPTNTGSIALYNDSEVISSPYTFRPGLNTIKISGDGELEIDRQDDHAGKIIFDLISTVSSSNNGVNVDLFKLDLTTTELTYLLNKLSTYNDIFYYTNTLVDSASSIDTDDMTNPLVMYDYNNVLNRFVISELDCTKFPDNITLTKSSRK